MELRYFIRPAISPLVGLLKHVSPAVRSTAISALTELAGYRKYELNFMVKKLM